jgi:hypothetical protein
MDATPANDPRRELGGFLTWLAEKRARELAATQPLSVVMAERIGALRAWAAGRTVATD